MSERYNVAASDVLGENYKITNIVCSDYNPRIDSTITVTVSVDDVYGDAISDESVTVTASEGNFTQLNGSDITSASSVTGTTNSSGQFTLTYTCTEWGLISFTANNTPTQIKVGGYKSLSLTNGTLYYDDEKVEYALSYQGSGNYSTNNAWIDSGAFDVVPSNLRPKKYVYSSMSSKHLIVRVNPSTGKLQYQTDQGISNPYFEGVLTWFLP